MVDAQGSLLDDYIKWRPQDKERISKLVNDGRLVIGPLVYTDRPVSDFGVKRS